MIGKSSLKYTRHAQFDRFKRPEIKRVLDLLNANSTSQPTYFRIVFEVVRRSISYIIVQTSTFKFPRFCKVREVPSIDIRAKVNKLLSCLRVLATRTKPARSQILRENG